MVNAVTVARLRLLGLAALAVLAVGCAESTAEVNTDGPDAIQADPQLIPGAQRVLAAAPTAEPGWRVGVVVAEDTPPVTGLFGEYREWYIGVLAADGGMVVLSGRWCDGEPEPNADRLLPVLVAPGDLVAWSRDHEVCLSELRVLRKSAAQQAAVPTASAT